MPPNAEDIQFHKILESLAWVRPEDLEIKPEYCHEQQWKLVTKSLKKADKAGPPEKIIGYFIRAYDTISTCSRLFSGQKHAESPEVTIVLIYLLIKACPQRVITAINYIDTFRLSIGGRSRSEFSYQVLKSAVRFLRSLKPNKDHDKGKLLIELKAKVSQFRDELSNKILEQSGPI